jgi:hypothetical protein
LERERASIVWFDRRATAVDPGVTKRRRISFKSTKLIASSQDDVNFYRRVPRILRELFDIKFQVSFAFLNLTSS